MFLATVPISMAANAAKRAVKRTAQGIKAVGSAALHGAEAVAKGALHGVEAAAKGALHGAEAAAKGALHSAEAAGKGALAGSTSSGVPNTANGTGASIDPAQSRISGGTIEDLVNEIKPKLTECLCESLAKMFTDTSPKLTNVVITEVENTLKTDPMIRNHIESRLKIIC